MGIRVIKNQALGFNIESDDCKGENRYCQPVQATDITVLQGYVTAGSAINLVEDGEFSGSGNWSLDAGWTISAGKLNATNIAGGSTADSVKPLGLVAGRLYLVQCSVDVTNVGSATSGQGFIIKINDQSLALPAGVTGYNADLTATWLFKCGTVTTDIIQFSTNESTIDFSVDYIRVYELSEVGVAIYDTDGNLQDSYTKDTIPASSDIDYFINGQTLTTGSILYTGTYDYNAELVLFEVTVNNWAGLTDYRGCINFNLYDTLLQTERVRNGTFTGGTNYWTLGAGWAYSGSNSVSYTGGLTFLEQTIYLYGGEEYTLNFTITNLGLFESMALYINDSFASSFQANGAKTYTIDLTAQTGIIAIKLGFTGGLPSDDNYTIDGVSVIAANLDTLNSSNCIDLRNTHDCTLLFYALNNDSAFGFSDVGTLRHYLRLYARIDLLGFREEREDYRFSDNSRVITYAMSESEYEVKIADAPDYIHACLRVMRLHDLFEIDGVEYVASGDYDLRGRKTSQLKQAIFSVKDADGISSNYSCT